MPDGSAPLRIAVLTSHSAPGLDRLLGDANRGIVYDIAGVITSETAFAQARTVEDAHVPLIVQPIREFTATHGVALRNFSARDEYDGELLHVIQSLRADFVFLVGYRFLLSDAFVDALPMKVLAIHDGDLLLRDDNRLRRYAGLHAVRNAIFDGATETRSSMFFVTRDAGEGPVFVLSAPYAVAPIAAAARSWGDADLLTSYATLHRRWLVQATWGPMLARAVEFLAAGIVQIVHDLAWIDGVPGPCRMGEAPGVCHSLESMVARGIPASCPLVKPHAE
jgi:folate-dependent phosphoribosylglycinamide formyltransferase PurN